MCTAVLAIDEDATCSDPTETRLTISSAKETCIDIQPPGKALGSKAATPPTYLPGACKPEGVEAHGTAEPSKPATFCCKP
jgi:hypothetical protein